MLTRCQATIAKDAVIQQPLLSNGFANKYVSTATSDSDSHLIRELLGTSGLKEGAAAAVGE
jgi:hypothetical protein